MEAIAPHELVRQMTHPREGRRPCDVNACEAKVL